MAACLSAPTSAPHAMAAVLRLYNTITWSHTRSRGALPGATGGAMRVGSWQRQAQAAHYQGRGGWVDGSVVVCRLRPKACLQQGTDCGLMGMCELASGVCAVRIICVGMGGCLLGSLQPLPSLLIRCEPLHHILVASRCRDSPHHLSYQPCASLPDPLLIMLTCSSTTLRPWSSVTGGWWPRGCAT